VHDAFCAIAERLFLSVWIRLLNILRDVDLDLLREGSFFCREVVIFVLSVEIVACEW